MKFSVDGVGCSGWKATVMRRILAPCNVMKEKKTVSLGEHEQGMVTLADTDASNGRIPRSQESRVHNDPWLG